ncbi:TPA: hypothetical protein IRP33_003325 [Escherichia coli]|nr:hypothetical protein [Escherichia coli]HAP0063035.1 hypothetical protein [Escherichia coli]
MKGEVKERGMIFNDEMVRAILEGRKTQTRRIMKNQPAEVGPEAPVMVRKIGAGFQWYGADGVSSVFNCPFGIVGDRIWVRETWAILGNEDGCSVDWNDNLCRGDEKNAARIYRASCEQKPGDYEAGNYPDIPDSSVPAPGKGVTGERIRIKPHVYRELVNRLHDTAIKCAGTQQLRERISRVLGDVITPYHHKQAEKSGLERCHLEAALNIKPGHTLGIIDALLVHKMARALLSLVDAGDTSEGEV